MSNPDAILVLEGHTDNRGDKVYNIRLGERRVEAVEGYLAVDKGVPVYKIEEISFGADKPVAPNDSKRAASRTVPLTRPSWRPPPVQYRFSLRADARASNMFR